MSEQSGLRLKTTGQIKELTDQFYQELWDAPKQGKKVCWILGPLPFEPVMAMGIKFIHLENYAARTSARKVIRPLLRLAEDESSLSRDTCSYMRAAQAMSLQWAQKRGNLPPDMEPYHIPRPDMIVAINYCVTALGVATLMSRELKVPVHIVDLSYHFTDGGHERYVAHMTRCIKELIAFLEEQTGKKMDYDVLSEILSNVKQGAMIRNETLNLGKHIPSPITVFDAFISIAAGNILKGTPEAVKYFKALKEEADERVKNGIAAVPGERIRLLWEYVAVWPYVGHHAKLFASHKAAVVVAPYPLTTMNWAPELIDPAKPVESMAMDLAGAWFQRGNPFKARMLAKWVDEFSIDGIIANHTRTCRKLCIGMYSYLDEVQRLTGVPVLNFDGDHSDPDWYSPAQVDNRITAFLEMLDARKRRMGL